MNSNRNISEHWVLPTVLFAVLGGMTWAVRGSSGYGAFAGCLFAGVTLGAAWWFLSVEAGPGLERPYRSGWLILALALGIGLSGERGWMQWPAFWEGRLQTNYAKGEFVPIPPNYGYLWLFIAGVPWAGIGACLLAWCGIGQKLGLAGWAMRLACAFGTAALARWTIQHFPEHFLPLYSAHAERYADLKANPNLRRLINDCTGAITHLGFYLGCLGFEAARRAWRNVALVAVVGLVNGLGWAALQNWSWARHFWPDSHFNFWRCWESSGGVSIGIAYGIAYGLVNRPMPYPADGTATDTPHVPVSALERAGIHLGLLIGLGLSIRSGLKGWANIYLGNEAHWDAVLWRCTWPLLIAGMAWIGWRAWLVPTATGVRPPAVAVDSHRVIWTVLIVQNVLAQLVTGPWSSWNEVVFSLYYLLLFAISALIVHHVHTVRRLRTDSEPGQRM